MPVGSGDFIIDFALPEPSPPPVTTIAWRLGHVIVGVLGERNARYFDGPAVSYADFDYPGLGRACRSRCSTTSMPAGSAASAPSTPTSWPHRAASRVSRTSPMADLVLHIHRELIHHLAEIALLRDLYLRA